MARDAGLSPPITGLWLSIPVGLFPQAYHKIPPGWKDQLLSFEQNAENPLLTPTSLSQILGESKNSSRKCPYLVEYYWKSDCLTYEKRRSVWATS